jgi:hypothetical protein
MRLRQGSILPREARDRLGLSAIEDNPDPVIIVISHDCDLVKPKEVEPKVELLHGRTRNELKPGLPYGQSPHMLHIEFMQQGEGKVLELCAVDKFSVDKTKLVNTDPDPDSAIGQKGLHILQLWLAARYNRAAFPDDLDRRMKPIKRKLQSLDAKAITGVWMKYSPDENRLDDKVPYELWVKIVYSTSEFDAKVKAEQEAKGLRASFERFFLDGDLWRFIDLQTCEAIPDTAFTLRDFDYYKPWRLEHLSLRQDPPEERL